MWSQQTEPDRRRFLRHVSAGVLGTSLGEMLAVEGMAETIGDSTRRAQNVLVIYEEGGISQMDTWDPKPDAPVDHRSPYQPISTNVPGIQFTSLMPLIARHADKLAVVRSMTTTPVAGHIEGCLEFFKGYRFDSPAFRGTSLSNHRFPDIGCVVADQIGTPAGDLPGYIFAPGANLPNHINGPGFLHRSRAAWKLGTKSLGEDVSVPGWGVQSLELLSGLNAPRLQGRRELMNVLDQSLVRREGLPQVFATQYEKAYDLLTSPTVRRVFDFSTETERTRDRYGRGHRGCCYLLGRKLIEAGVRFVTVTVIEPPSAVGRSKGTGEPNGVFLNWDHHEGIYFNGPCGGPQAAAGGERYGLPHPIMMPSLDRSLSALLEDMDQRGLLQDTLVCFITEMGRTPRINKWQGRDHWASAMSIAFAGAGVPGGQVIGSTDKEAGYVVSSRYTPCDYAETIYHKLGIDTHQRLHLPDGRPIDFTESGEPIRELF
ncbi:MAG: DUF1501 domain-containing protein [Planctomycetales bacterium]|nr:DUF1501 domain-containing protein [Planctomycetales bacterium]